MGLTTRMIGFHGNARLRTNGCRPAISTSRRDVCWSAVSVTKVIDKSWDVTIYIPLLFSTMGDLAHMEFNGMKFLG